MYIDVSSTINLTCIVKHLPEPPPGIYWTHNGEVGQASFVYNKFLKYFQRPNVLGLMHHCPLSSRFITKNIIFYRVSCPLYERTNLIKHFPFIKTGIKMSFANYDEFFINLFCRKSITIHRVAV